MVHLRFAAGLEALVSLTGVAVTNCGGKTVRRDLGAVLRAKVRKAMAGKFEVYPDKAGKFRFRLKASNGQVVATGEAYETKAAAKDGCEAVQRAANGAEVVETDA
jgi:uncharacterized protein YegP (UPF0339 family)